MVEVIYKWVKFPSEGTVSREKQSIGHPSVIRISKLLKKSASIRLQSTHAASTLVYENNYS